MANIYHQVLIKAARKTVYEAVTTQVGLSKWWIADCNVKPEIGYVNEFVVAGYGKNLMKVLALQTDTFVEWECLNENDPWTDTHLTFTLSDKGDFTCLDFRHTGYVAEDQVYATCNFHWARHLIMLKELCETGISQLNEAQEKREVDAVHKGKV
ncbi:SRPBCC family protein [Pontibacter vulgaris]|uniref:SRPBCC family protein n=1 Tax=Pontibacter vulgaris TaxID=2905679 RepID=UPI001FA6E382|nr:SRPBCC domain-containing protein [Pontibacter vulgaris]